MNIEGNLSGYFIKNKLDENKKSIIYRCAGPGGEGSYIVKVLNSEYPTNEEISEFLYPYELMKDIAIEGIPQVIEVISIKQTKGVVFYDNEAISLNRINFEMVSIREKLKIFLKTVEILEKIHQAGIIHKDINPSNIIYNNTTGYVGIIDFEDASTLSIEKASYDKNLFVGTLDYISPEQTGRMNRTIDYRTDYYSLGATFYEIFSGKRVFGETLTPLELIYYHVAKEPMQLFALDREIPKPVSAIIMKLLSKNAEDRYQSAAGIIADITLCLEKLNTHMYIENFEIGLKDNLSRFVIPQKLYGREKELSLIDKYYSRVCNEGFEVVLISGAAGIGKTSLVGEMQRKSIKKHGYYSSDKFDKSKMNLPYYAYESLAALVKQLLTENDEVVENAKNRILDAVGKNGRILFELVPELKYIIGEQPEVESLPPAETKNRLLFTFVEFLKVFMSRETPLTIFLDDCHWANEASIEFIKAILKAVDIRYFMFILAYRDEDLDQNSAFYDLISEIKGNSKANVSFITLNPLDEENVINLVTDTIGEEPLRNSSIAKAVMKATEGNPLLISDYLCTLNKKGYINFDITNMKWLWDEEGAGKVINENSDNKVIGARITTCSAVAREFLEAASIDGERFVLDRVLYLIHKRSDMIQEYIWELLEDRIIEPVEGNYSFVKNLSTNTEFRFTNQSLHQSIYQNIEENRKKLMHLKLGEKILSEMEDSNNEKLLFKIVHHLNIGKEVSNDSVLIKKIIKLNYEAGKKAMNSSSFKAALGYFQTSYKLTNENGEKSDINLLLGLIETAYSCSNDILMDKFYEEAISKEFDLITKAKLIEAKIKSLILKGESKEAVDISVSFLKELGVAIPRNPSQVDILKSLFKVKLLMAGKNIDKFAELPMLEDPKLLAIMSILNSAASSAFLAAPEVFMLIAMKELEISIKHGITPQSGYTFCKFGIILCGILGDLDTGYRMGQAALKLIEKFNTEKYVGRTLVCAGLFTNHWKEPLKDMIKLQSLGYEKSMEAGDVEYASWALLIREFTSFFAGNSLGVLKTEMEKTAFKIEIEMKQENQYYTVHSFLTLIDFLNNPNSAETGYFQKEMELKEKFEKDNYKNGLYYVYSNSMIKNLIMAEYDKAYEDSLEAIKCIGSVISTVNYPEFYFYSGLATALGKKDFSKEDIKSISKAKKNLKKWGSFGAKNHGYKALLLEAVIAERDMKKTLDTKVFDSIIAQALDNGFVQDAGLASEIAALFARKKGYETLFRAYLMDAYGLYGKWGADVKTAKLVYENPFLAEKSSLKASITGSIKQGIDNVYDSASLIKMSQILSSEIKYDRLIVNMMNIVMENAGAERGLFIAKNDDSLHVEAEFDLNMKENNTYVNENYGKYEGVYAKSVINYVARTGESIAFKDASKDSGSFVDEYIKNHEPKSILCVPIIAQNKIVGVLYFENNLISGAFTVERIDILKIIASQVAIAIENIRMYTNLEEKVKERTAELEQVNIILEQQKKEAEQAKLIADNATMTKSQFLANMSHEIRTPMNGIIGITYLLKRTELNLKQKDYLEKIEDSAKHLLNVINDILDFSKIEAGKITIDKTDFYLEDIIKRIENVLMKPCEDKGLEFMYYLEPKIPLKLNGDALRIQQVLINLAGNAVKFTSKGEILIKVEIIEMKEKSVNLRFSIKDTGIGLSKEQQGLLFKSFTQADGSITRKYGGTGLGLAICKSFVEMMGGTISVMSEEGVGSTFCFDLELDIAVESKKEKNDIFKLNGMKTLIVDDNETSIEILTLYMKSFGCIVDCARSGYEAIKKIKESPENTYKLLLIDWKMPGIDGIKTIEKIKSDDEISEIPFIIMVSAFDLDEIKDMGNELNINGYLTKPVQQSALLDSIVNVIGDNMSQLKDSVPNELEVHGKLSGKVLLVEDNVVNQIVAEEILETFGLEVEIASGGIEAVEKASKEDFNLILMDIQMPDIDGFEATRRIKEKGIKTPIIAMTANAMKGDMEKCLEMNMQDYVTKPIDVDELYKVITKWISSTEATGKNAEDKVLELNFAGVNEKNALRRMMGNKNILMKVIKAFILEFGDASAKISGYRSTEDTESLKYFLHSLKGSSGNIAAENLYLKTSEIEMKLKNHLEVTEEEFMELDSLIAELLSNASFFENEAAKAMVEAVNIAKLPKMKEMLVKLKEALEIGSFESEFIFCKIEDSLNGIKTPEFDSLRQAIFSIDYEKSLDLVNSILEKNF
jgi:predicted ATPase/signal transduction histidine kinase/CheY-like chemotaxis protein/HPt (histidine-containing phosphotransfer) domain-containing protein